MKIYFWLSLVIQKICYRYTKWNDHSNKLFLLILQKATMLRCNRRSLPLNCFQYWGILHTNIRKEQKDKWDLDSFSSTKNETSSVDGSAGTVSVTKLPNAMLQTSGATSFLVFNIVWITTWNSISYRFMNSPNDHLSISWK